MPSHPPLQDLPANVVRANTALSALRAAWSERYAQVVCDVTVAAASDGGGVRVAGEVLVPAQRAAILARLGDALGGTPVASDIRTLTERDAHAGWAVPAGPWIDILASPSGEMATQLLREDQPARRLVRRGDWWAVELADGTVGWVRDLDVIDASPERIPADVAGWRRDFGGRGESAPTPASPAQWRAALAPWLGTPYRWGGNSPAGIDCSGLTQRLYRAVMGIGLPKNSRDQCRAGRRVGRAALAVGDLVHLTHKARGIGHVAVVVDDEPLVVAHASFDAGEVVVEPLEAMLVRYAFRGARRFGATGAPDAGHEGAPGGMQEVGSDSIRVSRGDAWASLRALADRNVHVVGLASTEGAAIVRFLWDEGVRRLTVHDFQPADRAEAAFRQFHVGMPPAERERVWQELAAMPIERRFGERYLEGIAAADAIFAPQAWYLYSPNLPALADRRAAGVPFHGITGLYFDLAPARILAVTGSNGKSTTSRLAETILRLTDQTIYYAGNERRSVQVLHRLREMRGSDWLVLEVSNRQLMDADPRPRIGVVTNVLPNHLDEHGGSMEAYAAVKRKLVARQGPGDAAVLSADNPATRAMAEGLAGDVYWFSRSGPVPRGAWLEGGRIRLRVEEGGTAPHASATSDTAAIDVGPISLMRLPGAHNVDNALAAVTAAFLAGASVDAIRRGLAAFRGLRHRLQFVWRAGGVDYYDDLNSTTPQATAAALDSLDAPIVLIAGGDDKGLDFGALADRVAAKARRLILLPGPGSERIAAAVSARSGAAPVPIDRFETLGEAVAAAVRGARPGDRVLLSPGCPAFFSRHYLAGGDELGFRALLRDLAVDRPT